MPSSTERQKRYVYYLRDKYKDKASTPEKYQWVWNDEWLTVKKEQRQQLTIWKSIYKEEEIDQTKTPEFKKWFGKSKVVKNGKPLIVYHGSSIGFNTFDAKKIGSHTDDGIWGKGFYFSDERTAKKYGANVVGVFLSIKNPYMITGKESIQEVADYLEIDESILKADAGFVRPYIPYIGVFTSHIKEKGHDGIIVDRGGISNEFVVFNANQIKSATDNNGNFSKNSNNIYESLTLPIEKGDTILWGKWKNKRAVVDHFDVNEKNEPVIVTDTGKIIPLLKVRLMKENEELEEDLHLSDFKKHSAISPYATKFMKDRQRLKGTGNKSAKLLVRKMKVNRKLDYIKIYFASVPTYTSTANAIAIPNDKVFKRVKAYTQIIQFDNFFALASTKPNYDEAKLTWKEIKEVIEACTIKVDCNCPAYLLQGSAYYDTLFNAALHPEHREPKRWNILHKEFNLACKHLDILMTSGMNVWKNNITSSINKYLKSKKG